MSSPTSADREQLQERMRQLKKTLKGLEERRKKVPEEEPNEEYDPFSGIQPISAIKIAIENSPTIQSPKIKRIAEELQDLVAFSDMPTREISQQPTNQVSLQPSNQISRYPTNDRDLTKQFNSYYNSDDEDFEVKNITFDMLGTKDDPNHECKAKIRKGHKYLKPGVQQGRKKRTRTVSTDLQPSHAKLLSGTQLSQKQRRNSQTQSRPHSRPRPDRKSLQHPQFSASKITKKIQCQPQLIRSYTVDAKTRKNDRLQLKTQQYRSTSPLRKKNCQFCSSLLNRGYSSVSCARCHGNLKRK